MNKQQASASESESGKHDHLLQKMPGQKSFTSMSSCESDTEIVNCMPNMTTQYEKTHFLTKPGEESPSVSRSAGDVLLNGDSHLGLNSLVDKQNLNGDSHRYKDKSSAMPQEKEVSNPDLANNEYGDEIDAVPTRSDRKLSKDSQIPAKISPVSSTTTDLPAVEEEGQLCSKTFFALFEWKTILDKFSAVDLFFVLVSTGFFFFDVITDILNAYSYYDKRSEHKDNLLYFWLTAVLIVVPSIISQAFSLWWEAEDETELRMQREEQGRTESHSFCYWFLIAQMHIFQIAPLFRLSLNVFRFKPGLKSNAFVNNIDGYFRAAYFGVRSRYEEQKKDTQKEVFYNNKWKYEHCDVSFLRLFESFLESAPQLVLQIYIMVTTMQTPFITVISCLGSWGGLSIAFLSFQRALRSSQRKMEQISIAASIFLVLYRSCTILSRVFALALLLNVHIWAWLGLFLVHWGVMTGWIICHGTNFCNSKVKEYIYDIVVGFCYNFAYLNVTGMHGNKRRMIFFYTIMFIENCICAGVWIKYRHGGGNLIDALIGSSLANPAESTVTMPPDVALTIVVIIPSVFILGVLFMLLYYTFFHPVTGDMPCCKTARNPSETEEASVKEVGEEPSSTGVCVELREHSESFRSYRKSEICRSWPSGSVSLEETPKQSKTPRPRSQVVESSGSSLFDEPAPLQSVSVAKPVEVNSSYCSCYSLRHEADLSNFNRDKTAQAMVHSTSQLQSSGEIIRTPQKGAVTHSQEHEVKCLKVELLIQEKKRQKREVEKKLMQLNLQSQPSPQSTKSPQSPTEELFNRRERAKFLAGKEPSSFSKSSTYQSRLSSPVAVPISDRSMSTLREKSTTKPNQPQPTHTYTDIKQTVACHSSPSSKSLAAHRRRLNSEEMSFETVKMLQMSAMPAKCGTFPRCSRRQDLSTPSRSQGSTLKTIRENKLAMHAARGSRDYSASLSNIAIKHQISGSLKKSKVPRAMSFTVSKNEQVISIESTL